MGYGYTVLSRPKSSKFWRVERTYGVESYAKQVANSIKLSGKRVKIRRN